MSDFQEFPKIPRLNRAIVVTEKIDGTNAQVYVVEAGWPTDDALPAQAVAKVAGCYVYAGSRNRWLTPADPLVGRTKAQDNFGFAQWVRDHAEELVLGLGPGRHFGEWWGSGINRGYGMAEKRFSLFNVSKWADTHHGTPPEFLAQGQAYAPLCCHVVPVLYEGPWFVAQDRNLGAMHSQVGTSGQQCTTWAPTWACDQLRAKGSQASPGFMRPEGVVVFHTASSQLFKVTLEGDEKPKGAR